MRKAIGPLIVVAVMTISGVADAHTLRIDCKKTSGENVVCRALFSDGEVARGMPVQLIDDQEKLLATGKTDVQGKYAFKAPGPEYNVVVQASKGEIASMSAEDIW
jgi:hypothetical protein